MKNAIETDGLLTTGNLEDIVRTYQNMFTTTKEASFTLSQDHNTEQIITKEHNPEQSKPIDTLPPRKPQPQNNIPRKRLKSSQEIAVSGKKNSPKCSFCGRHANIKSCPMIANTGVRLNALEMEKFCTIINCIHLMNGKIDFEDWSCDNSVLMDTNTKTAHHAVLHGLYRYEFQGNSPMVVVGVQFLSDGGIPLLGYDLVPMKLENIVCPIQQKFHGKKTSKYLLSTYQLYVYANNMNL